jgi:4-amino-4-deoxy-L-arabinose transferase-like glycosyltransferase
MNASASTSSLPEEKVQAITIPPWSKKNAWALLATFILATAVFFNGIGSFPLFNPDEALYAEPAREMLKNGDYLTTHLNYIVRYTKPPLVIWAQAFLFSLFGVSEGVARSFGAACGVILVVLTQAFLTRYVSLRAGIVAATSLIAAPLFFATARECITDMPLSLFLASSLMAFYAAFHEKRNKLLATAGYVLMAFAVMTKGPVAIVLPVAILTTYFLTTGGLKQAWQRFFPLIGAAIVATLALPWFVLEIIATKGEYFQEFFVRENFQRFTAVVDSHKEPVWYHTAAVMGGYFPFSLFLPMAFFETARNLKEHLKAPLSAANGWLERARAVPAALSKMDLSSSLQYFAALWLVITVAFFSASVSKLLPYTLPAFPAAAILFALETERVFAQSGRRRLSIPISLLAVAYAVAFFLMPFILGKVRNMPDGVLPLVQPAIAACAVSMTIAWISSWLNKKQVAVGLLLATQVLIAGLLAPPVTIALSKQWEGPIPELSRMVGKFEEPAFVFDMRKPGVPFYADRQMSQAWTWAVLTSELARMPRAYVITRARNKGPFMEMPGFTVLKEEGLYMLLRFDNPFAPKAPYVPSPGIHSMQR